MTDATPNIDQREIDNAPIVPVNCHLCAERAALIQHIAELDQKANRTCLYYHDNPGSRFPQEWRTGCKQSVAVIEPPKYCPHCGGKVEVSDA